MESPLFLSDLLTALERGRDALPRVQVNQQVGPTRFVGG
jgi:hypothetical protein